MVSFLNRKEKTRAMLKLIVVVWLCISFSSHASAKHSAAQLLSRVESTLKVSNFGLGTYSRSSIIAAVSQSLRGEEDAKVRENLNQAIVTLAVLDIGGGALLPVTEHIVEQISKKSTFQATNQAWKNYNTKIKDKLSANLDTLDDVEVKRVLKIEKNKVLKAFETDVGNLGNVAEGSKTLKYIKKAQKWLKVKSVTKVLGPIFDVVGIGIDAWSLATTIQDCTTTPATCNYGQIASSTLGIASSVVGIATFVASLLVSSSVLGPVGAVVGLVLAIGATLIDIFYEPPVDYAAIARRQKFETMMELDKYSRMQLYTAHKFLLDNEVARDDLYVVNQGHLPGWGVVSPKITLQFGKSNIGYKRQKEPLNAKCESPKRLGVPERGFTCDYLADGSMRQQSGYILGHAFYGFTKTAQTYPEGGSRPQDPPYGGSIILVNTDQVQRDSLGEIDSNLIVRGYEIRSDLKTNDGLPYDDVVVLGKMPNLAWKEKITITTGAGNDALNIDGMFGLYTSNFENILDADLGNQGHNTLSFHGASESSGIEGINYNAVTGVLLFRSMAAGTLHHRVGTVKNVEFVGGSPFSDVITLGATKRGENGIDFTAIKRKGSSRYVIDIQSLASQSETRHFKIIDSTEGPDMSDIYDDPCDGYTPGLEIENFDSDAVSNDILYQSGKIKIYGHRTNGKKRSVRSKLTNPWKPRGMGLSSAAKRQANPCSGETPIETHRKGGQDGKVLLATVTVHSKCGLMVSSTNEDGGCMAYSDRMEELDLVFYEGSNFTYNFGGNSQGGQKSDVAHLECPESPVNDKYTLNLGGSSGDRVVVGGRFFDDCEIDGKLKHLYMFKRPWKILNGKQIYLWELEFLNNPKFPAKIGEPGGWKQRLAGVERIVNEYGDEIANMNKFTDFMNLYEAYNKVTMNTIAGILGSKRSTEIKSEVLTCLQDGADVAHPDLCDKYASD